MHRAHSSLKARALREDIRQRLADERAARYTWRSPEHDLFERTSAYIGAINKIGCCRPKREPTLRTGDELDTFNTQEAERKLHRRGYSSPQPSCEGRIIYHNIPDDSPNDGLQRGPYLSCEHYTRQNHHHWVDFTIANVQYLLEYIAAVFTADEEATKQIEDAAAKQAHGPRATCSTVVNISNQRSICPIDHRQDDGHLTQKSLGVHQHVIPVPEKTPRPVHNQILKLLEQLREDLPDMTPQRFLRHSIVKAFLHNHFPDISCPTLSTLHSSLANRSHISSYITRAKKENFPEGTDWDGICHLKRKQDEALPEEEHYIRAILEFNDEMLPIHDEDDPPGSEKKTRIIICMAREGSERLQKNGAYIQSDIGFKRIVGFDEFEMASMDRDANTSVIFCRVYLTRHTAAAHHHIFKEIQRIVEKDTGVKLLWRHLHASILGDFNGMILHWTADQHCGKAKGLGLHLVELALALPADRMDLHEPHRPLQDLGPYDHLRRLFRLCTVHNFRNIKTCPVPEPVRQLMRSLSCISHPDWDGTLAKIRADGGKTAQDWVRDKETCQFAFAGLCHEKSFIPLPIWKAGEADSGLLKGCEFDSLKFQTLKHWEDFGIRPTNQPVSMVVNTLKNAKRKGKFIQWPHSSLPDRSLDNTHARCVAQVDAQIQQHNDSMEKCHAQFEAALQTVQRLEQSATLSIAEGGPLARKQLAAAHTAVAAVRLKYQDQADIGRRLFASSHAQGILLAGEKT
ncbi:hypothetical protein DFH09DRAFT_1314192 [Mycena vulgaris]|nr:hypothetical protein DFH09DRAFT_1314192 [Mycena vulgaris]